MADQLALPEFEGSVPVGVQTIVTGTSQRIRRPIHHKETGVLVVEYEVGDIRHPMTGDGLVRKQVLKATDFYELGHDEGHALLVRLRTEYLEAQGKVELPLADDGTAVTVDGDTASAALADLEAVVELERGRGRCAEVLDADAHELCKRPQGHAGKHDPT